VRGSEGEVVEKGSAGVLTLVLYLPTLRWMYSEWTGSIWVNAHGVFVPVAMAYLAYSRLRLDPSREPDSSPWGFAFLVPGLALTILDMATRTRYLAAVGLVLCLPGLCLLLLGARRTRDLVVPLLVGIFMVPIPDTPPTHLWLRDATAMGVEPLLSLVGMPVLRDGTLIEIPSGAFVVSNACSGFATLYASIGVALVLVLSTRSWTRRALVLLSVVPLAVACNVLRVVLLVLLTHYLGPEILHTPVHEASGVATFMIVIFALWTLGSERFTLEAPA